ncbi:hypothetical protein PST407_02350 [Pseudomonas syringae pv. tomato]|nr:hypothetical protein PST407_02350 [Pseudomonas syringae pv. tomato]
MSVPKPPPPEARAARVPVTSCPSPRRGAVSRRTPSRSKSTAMGSRSARALATRNTRRRRWARPKYWASRIRHAIVLLGPYTQPASFHRFPGGCSSQSSPASAPRKHPKALPLSERTPGTFSQTMMLSGWLRLVRTWSTASASSTYLMVRAPRGSSMPWRIPATLNAWHGVPPTRTSGASILPASTRAPSLVMSPRFGVRG